MSVKRTVPANVRVMIAIVASPTLAVIGFLIYSLVFGQWRDITIGTGVFSLLGLWAYFVVFTGRLPVFRRNELEH